MRDGARRRRRRRRYCCLFSARHERRRAQELLDLLVRHRAPRGEGRGPLGEDRGRRHGGCGGDGGGGGLGVGETGCFFFFFWLVERLREKRKERRRKNQSLLADDAKTSTPKCTDDALFSSSCDAVGGARYRNGRSRAPRGWEHRLGVPSEEGRKRKKRMGSRGIVFFFFLFLPLSGLWRLQAIVFFSFDRPVAV